MTNPIYDDLQNALEEAIPEDKVLYGTLGFTVKGQYAVVVPESTHLYRVVMDDGSFQEIPHKGSCSPTPGLRVEIQYDRFDKPYISGVEDNANAATNPTTAGQYYVAHHSHGRGSGMEFPIDLRLVNQFYVELQGGLEIYIRPGFYYYNSELRYWNGGYVNVGSAIPSQASSYKWTMLCFDAETESMTLLEGATLNFLVESIGPERIVEIDVLSKGLIPICAIQLKKGMQDVVDEQIVSLFDMLPSFALQSDPVQLSQITTNQLITTSWTPLVWDESYNKLGYLTLEPTNDGFTLIEGKWTIQRLDALYIQLNGDVDSVAIRLYNETQATEVLLVESLSGNDSSIHKPTFPTTEFISNGTDVFSIQVKSTLYDFSRTFPTTLELQKI